LRPPAILCTLLAELTRTLNAVLSRCRLTAVGLIVARPRQSAWTHS
jgi:hypothetical protein